MALAITAVLASGKELPTVAAGISWTGCQLKDALGEYIDQGCVSAVVYKGQLVADDLPLEQCGIDINDDAAPTDVRLEIVVSEPAKLAEVAQLPGMSADYKFRNWTGDDFYSDEEDFYRQKAANTECYSLKQMGPEDDAVMKVTMPQAWLDLYAAFTAQNDGREPDLGSFQESRKFLEKAYGIIHKMSDAINRVVRQALSAKYEGLDRVDFTVNNNTGATAKYQIIDGHSSQAITFPDHPTPLYLLFVGSARYGKTEMELRLGNVYLSDDKYCGVHKPFYM